MKEQWLRSAEHMDKVIASLESRIAFHTTGLRSATKAGHEPQIMVESNEIAVLTKLRDEWAVKVADIRAKLAVMPD